jgi:Dolichyl-phosphate-mannose-protein mannosyltransferase
VTSRVRATIGLAASIFLWSLAAAGVEVHAAADRGALSIPVGPGHSSVVEFDRDFQPLRRYVGFERPTDVTPLDDGTYLIVDEIAGDVLSLDPRGAVVWREHFGGGVQRARPRRNGGLVVTTVDKVLLTDPARKIVREFPVKGIRAAVELANGKVLVAYNDNQGWLAEIQADGSVVARSKPLKRLDEHGQWVAEPADRTFVSVHSLDVGSDGMIFTSSFDGHDLRLLTATYETLRSWHVAGLGHFFDTRIGPSGELVAVAPEQNTVWVRWNGTERSWTSREVSRVYCANFTRGGTLVVGVQWVPENERLNAAVRGTPSRGPRRASNSLLVSILLGLAGALVVSGIVLSQGAPRAPLPGVIEESIPAAPRAFRPATGPASLPRRAANAAGVAALAMAVWIAWPGSPQLAGAGNFWIGCFVGGVALRLLNRLADSDGTLSSFSPAAPAWRGFASADRTWHLTGLSAACIGVATLLARSGPAAQPVAVAAWIAGQVFLLAAAWDGPSRLASRAISTRAGRGRLLVLVVLAAMATRFWEIGRLPDSVHWDHGIYGSAALHVLQGDWKPFFVLDPNCPSISRPWISVCALLLGIFGSHYWVLRLTAALSGVLLVLGAYLLGSSLFNRRVGLIAALLATVNHVLLLYSRQPYLLDPAPLFVLALYFASRALKGGTRLHWCLAGMLGGWVVLTYWASVTLAVVGAGIFLGFLLVYPRTLWRHRMGIVWLFIGCLVVYAPMLPHMSSHSSLAARMHAMFVVFNPDGSIRTEPGFWRQQLRMAFGTILDYGDRSPWNVSTGRPICIGAEALLFGTGLTYLLVSGRLACLIVVIPWIVVGFFFGNALFADPLVLYHCLSVITPILLATSVSIDRLLAPTDNWESTRHRLVAKLAVGALLGGLALSHLRAVRKVVGALPEKAGAGDRQFWRADFRTIVPRFIREHPGYRYYLVRTSTGLTCAEPSFIFFADDSDVSDVTGGIETVLPISPEGSPNGAAFVILPERAESGERIRSVYPNARKRELVSTTTGSSAVVYVVGPRNVRNRYERTLGTIGRPAGR